MLTTLLWRLLIIVGCLGAIALIAFMAIHMGGGSDKHELRTAGDYELVPISADRQLMIYHISDGHYVAAEGNKRLEEAILRLKAAVLPGGTREVVVAVYDNLDRPGTPVVGYKDAYIVSTIDLKGAVGDIMSKSKYLPAVVLAGRTSDGRVKWAFNP